MQSELFMSIRLEFGPVAHSSARLQRCCELPERPDVVGSRIYEFEPHHEAHIVAEAVIRPG